MVKVSVIIPVYNTQDYLSECLDRVLNQSLTDIEIICINDGSTDASMEILKDYQNRDSRIKIISQENKGSGASRNVALKSSIGEYVYFLDSDDYLDLDALRQLYEISADNDLDYVMFKITNFNYKSRKESHSSYFDMPFIHESVGDNVFDWTQIREHVFDVSVSVTSKLYKRDFICDFTFPEGLIFEDNVFSIKTLFNAKRIYFYEKYLYYRRVHPNSITHSAYDKFKDCIAVYDLIIDYIKVIGLYEEFKVQIFNRECHDVFHRFALVSDEFKRDFFNSIQSSFSMRKKELEDEGILKNCSKRSLKIFDSALNSNNYEDFESSVKRFYLHGKPKKSNFGNLKKFIKKYI